MRQTSSKEDWDEFWRRKHQVDNVYSNIDRIVSNLKKVVDLSGKRILEIGAGTARDSFPFTDEGAKVFVLDYSPQAIDIVSQLNRLQKTKIYPLLADATMIPAADESFDIVFHQGLIEHFKDPEPIIRENVRVLKKGGLLLIDVPQKYHIYTVIKHILIFFNKWFAGWETEFTINQLKRLVEQEGVHVIYRYGRWMRPSLIYRILREILLSVGFKLPLYPQGPKLMRRIRDSFRNQLMQSRWSFYTFIDIGVIAKKLY